MYILTPGNRERAEAIRNEEKIFLCHLCGCRWKANQDDYVRNWDYQTGNYIMSSVCPCCNEVIQLTEQG